MSSVLSAQHWNTSHPNVSTRKMIKKSSLEDALLEKKKFTRLLTIQKKKWRSKSVKTGFDRKFQNF
jgi:hypothetical protein